MKNWNVLSVVVAGCLLLASGLAGCKGGGKAADSGANAAAATADVDAVIKPEFRYKVIASATAFYHVSPLQAGGVDEMIKKDTRITLLKRYGGYSQIKTVGGISGYVASDEITQISAQESAAEDAERQARLAPPSALAPMTSGPGGNYSIPPEATRDTVLPVPDASPTPKGTPNPMFRY